MGITQQSILPGIFSRWRRSALFIVSGLMMGLIFGGCQSDSAEAVPDVPELPVPLEVQRFDQDLLRLDTSRMDTELARLESAYPDFAPLYFGQILQLPEDPALRAAQLKGLLQFEGTQLVAQTIDSLYRDFSPWEEELTQALRYYHYYLPEKPIPTLTTLLSEFSIISFIYGNDDLAVGLDYFLGENFPYGQMAPIDPMFSDYLNRTYRPEYLVRKTLEALVEDNAGPPMGNRLVDHMIYNGKKLYLMEKLLPHHPDSILLEVSAQQVDWLEDNRLEMWAYFIKEDLFYSNVWSRIRKYVDYSPDSPGMPPEAPGRTANYLGWQIVKAYARRFPEQTVADIMALLDAQQVLTDSRYKPRR